MNFPLVSILIPAYNAEKYIAEAIESCLSQSYSNIEVIVIDDGSNDLTFEIASSFTDRRITILKQENKGAAAARNTAFSKSRGELIQYLDADDILGKDKIRLEMDLYSQYGNSYLYSCCYGIFYQTPAESKFTASTLCKDFNSGIEWLIASWTTNQWFPPSVWLTPRNLIQSSGGWNESLSLHDDGEFFSRILLLSSGVRFSALARVYYRKGIEDSLSSIISFKAVQSHLNICSLYERHLLNSEDSLRTRAACASNYLQFNFVYYPNFKNLRKQALKSAVRLGGADCQPQGTELFHWIKSLTGWRLARLFERWYYKNRHGRLKLFINKIRSISHL